MKKQQISEWLAKAIVLTCSILLFGGCVSAKQKLLDAGMKPMDNQELTSLFSKPFEANYVSSKNGTTSLVQYFPDGAQKINNPRITDEGTWKIENGEQCSKWTKIRKGAERCTVWFKVSSDKYEVYNRGGSKAGVITIK